jgi:hypothetical protein
MAKFALFSISLLVLVTPIAEGDTVIARLSLNDIMVMIVTPATDTLWGIEDPQSDAEWQVFEDAAGQVIDAFGQIRTHDAVPGGAARPEDSRWIAFSDEVIKSARDAKQAIRERDLDAVFTATDEMYPPCESCHLVFHPGS